MGILLLLVCSFNTSSMLAACLHYTGTFNFRFATVSYCGHTRRIGVGAKNGGVGIYELKQGKCQVSSIHTTGYDFRVTYAKRKTKI